MSVQVRERVKRKALGSVHLALPAGWRSEPQSADFSFRRAGETKTVSFVVTPAAIEQKRNKLTAVADEQVRTTSEGFRAVGIED